MKVKELIEKLSCYDENLEIACYDSENDEYADVKSIELEEIDEVKSVNIII